MAAFAGRMDARVRQSAVHRAMMPLLALLRSRRADSGASLSSTITPATNLFGSSLRQSVYDSTRIALSARPTRLAPNHTNRPSIRQQNTVEHEIAGLGEDAADLPSLQFVP
jgi:hypothetical protein